MRLKRALLPVLAIFLITLFASSCVFTGTDQNSNGDCPVRILQVYGSGNASDGAVSASFIELYNTSDKDFNLTGYSLQVANGITESNPDVLPWKSLDLRGKTIKAKSSFLIRGANTNEAARLMITDPDMTWDIKISNRSYKVCLVKNTAIIPYGNPFDADGRGNKIPGYVDMVGAVNDPSLGDEIDGFESEKVEGISKQKAIRRRNLTDSDNNRVDFAVIDYRTTGVSEAKLEKLRPRNTASGAWNPEYLASDRKYHNLAGKLMILQAAASTSDGAISNSFIELYNASDQDISLSNYYIHYTSGLGSDWSIIPLGNSTIKARRSFLILGTRTNNTARLVINESEADLTAPFNLNNRGFKVVLMNSNQALTVENPFDTDGKGKKATGYVDMLGTVNNPDDPDFDQADGYETDPFEGVSKQRSARRASLWDSDDNSMDFIDIDYRVTGTTEAQMNNLKPKNSTYGKWNPMTFQKI